MPAAEVIAAVGRRGLSARIVVLGAWGSKDDALRWLAAGVAGLVLESEPASLVVSAIEAAAQGSAWVSPAALSLFATSDDDDGACQPEPALSGRERQVVRLLARGETNKEIAKVLGVCERTVRFHLGNLYGKLGCGGRGELVAWAVRALADGEDRAEPPLS